MVKKMGSFKNILKMLPGMGSLGDLDFSEKEFGKLEAMILSMTPSERQEKDELSVSRRKRIADGSGTKIDDVNRMVKGFKRVKQMFKGMPGLSGMKGMPSMKDLNSMKAQAQKMGLKDVMNMGWPPKN
jgi:signal recognition particle subunit SRP54